MRSRGRDPFSQTRYDVNARAAELREKWDEDARYRLAGRIMAKRGTGKTLFVDLHDRSGQIQLYVRKDEVGDAFADWEDLDRGDFVGVKGYMFRSKMGEPTLHVETFTVLGKAVAPLPDKWHGLVDVEKRYRQRYVDLIVNTEVRDVFIARSRVL
ncbi:MAG: lysine--tRNA ligase, partial [Candidatus Eremiobacteraeota bacterium]|nr:lysine--tRNA ligase [Candidatus Eremiobacteraeota bacterium]